jgi:hypothetical protein
MVARRVSVLLALVATMSCGAGGESTSPSNAGTVTYTLSAINGRSLPAVLGENPLGKMEILAESYRLESSLRYIHTQDYRQTDAAGVRTGTLTDTGTYVSRTDSIFFTFSRPSGAFQTPAGIESGRLVIRYAAQGVTLVFDQSR